MHINKNYQNDCRILDFYHNCIRSCWFVHSGCSFHGCKTESMSFVKSSLWFCMALIKLWGCALIRMENTSR